MNSPSRRGPYAKTADQRRRILEVAVDVFGRLGNRGSSLREIADKVGMSQAGVLHHFDSKDNLLLAVLEQRDDDGEASPQSAADAYAGLRGLLERAQANPGLTQLFATISAEATDPEHPAHDFIVERYRRTVATFQAGAESAKKSGELVESVDSAALSRLLVAVMDGLQLQALLHNDANILASFDLLVDALGKATTPR